MTHRNKDKYQECIRQQKNLPLFYRDWWLDAVAGEENWEASVATDDGGRITGIWPYLPMKLRGLPVLANPPFSPYLGPRLIYPDNPMTLTSRYSFEMRTLGQLADQLPGNHWYGRFSCHPDFRNGYPLFWRGFSLETAYTYILSDIQDQEKLYSGFTNTLRRQIREARDIYSIRESDDTGSLYRYLKTTLARQGVRWHFSPAQMQTLYDSVREHEAGVLLEATEKGKVAAALWMVWDDESAYCLGLGMDPMAGPNNAIKGLLWESIQRAAEKTTQYNFEGSMIPNVERVFRSFGGTRQEYYRMIWYKNRLIKAMFALMNK